jgi:hypothetical protein
VHLRISARQQLEQRERNWSEWQSRRRSPARCLECAGPVASVPARDDESLPHLRCGGTIKTGITIGSSLERAATYPHVYDIEGALLEQGRRPTFPNGGFIPTYEPLKLFCEDLRALVDARRAFDASLR